jgi:hypothetical protein
MFVKGLEFYQVMTFIPDIILTVTSRKAHSGIMFPIKKVLKYETSGYKRTNSGLGREI